jgi:hypothetical protein
MARLNAIEKNILKDANSLQARYLAARRANGNLIADGVRLRNERSRLMKQLNTISKNNGAQRAPLARRIGQLGRNIKNLDPRFASIRNNIARLQKGLELRQKLISVRPSAVSRIVRTAGAAFIAPLYKPATSSSPAGMRAAAALNAHMPAMSYKNVHATMRGILRERRKLENERVRRG